MPPKPGSRKRKAKPDDAPRDDFEDDDGSFEPALPEKRVSTRTRKESTKQKALSKPLIAAVSSTKSPTGEQKDQAILKRLEQLERENKRLRRQNAAAQESAALSPGTHSFYSCSKSYPLLIMYSKTTKRSSKAKRNKSTSSMLVNISLL